MEAQRMSLGIGDIDVEYTALLGESQNGQS